MSGTIDRDAEEWPFEQVAAILKAAIESGELPPGSKLPSEADLCAAHGVARNTARAAVAMLRDAGYVRTRRGRGTFVVDRGPVGSGESA
jgi:DNA-binding GntR family transcriptional regulator